MIKCKFPDGNEFEFRHVTVDAVVVKDGKILLIKRAEDKKREPGKWAVPGGFLDLNENTTEGVMRELLEETGYEALKTEIFWINSKPQRTETQDVTFVFLVEVGEQVGEHDNEVSEVKWFEEEELPEMQEFAFDHYDIIQLYLDYKKQKFNLPVLDL